MNREISIIPDKQIVVLHSYGKITLADRIRNQQETIDFCREKGIRNVIIDTRGQISCSSTTALFDFAETIAKATHGFRLAYIRDCKDTVVQFIENVAANRGAITESFVSFEKAQKWLESLDSEYSQCIDSNKQ